MFVAFCEEHLLALHIQCCYYPLLIDEYNDGIRNAIHSYKCIIIIR